MFPVESKGESPTFREVMNHTQHKCTSVNYISAFKGVAKRL
eukprot:gene5738-4099_t